MRRDGGSAAHPARVGFPRGESPRVGPAVVWDGKGARLRVWVPGPDGGADGDGGAGTAVSIPLSLAQLVALNHDAAAALVQATCQARRAGRLIDTINGEAE